MTPQGLGQKLGHGYDGDLIPDSHQPWSCEDHRLKGSYQMHKVKIAFLLLGKQFPHHLQKVAQCYQLQAILLTT